MLAPIIWVLIIVGMVAWLVTGCVAAGHAVIHKRDPRSAAIWVMLAFLVPLVGPWAYWGLGINRIERRAAKQFRGRERPFPPPEIADIEPPPEGSLEAVGHLDSLRRVADRVTRLPLLPGNSVTPLHNGEQAYPSMLEAIGRAERTITLASYIFDWDEVGHQFADALGAAAGRGVRVHVLVDGIGALKSFSRMGRRLLKAGAEVAAFFPLRFPFGRLRINLRNHRKILVVDGRIGFTGGMNISERHLIGRPRPGRSSDLHFQLTGPVVAELQHVFTEDWYMATGEVLGGEAYFPRLSATGSALCRGIVSGPDEDFEKIHWIMQTAFASARHRVRMATPYFVPTWPIYSSMAMAALRGVDIALLLPSELDYPFMRWVADAYLWQFLEHGTRIYHQPPPFHHTKLLVVDDRWVLLGSANCDRRSFRLNFEFNVEVYDMALAQGLARWLDERVASSKQVTLEEVDSRPTLQRLRDGTAKLLSPYL